MASSLWTVFPTWTFNHFPIMFPIYPDFLTIALMSFVSGILLLLWPMVLYNTALGARSAHLPAVAYPRLQVCISLVSLPIHQLQSVCISPLVKLHSQDQHCAHNSSTHHCFVHMLCLSRMSLKYFSISSRTITTTQNPRRNQSVLSWLPCFTIWGNLEMLLDVVAAFQNCHNRCSPLLPLHQPYPRHLASHTHVLFPPGLCWHH